MNRLALLLLISLALIAPSLAHAGQGDWTSLTLNGSNARFQANSGINASNIAQLVPVWNITTGNSVTSTPIVFNGNVYFSDWGGYVWSANVLNGQVNWKENLGGGISSTPLVSDGVLYIALGPDGTADTGRAGNVLIGPNAVIVFALNQYNGQIKWSENLNQTTKMDAIWASPIIYKNLLYIGVASQGDESNPTWQGQIYALKTDSGSIAWNDILASPAGGDGLWGSVVIDPQLNSIYFGTGNPYSNVTSNSLYGYAVLSIDAGNGNINWATQTCTGGLDVCGDADFGSTPNLFTYTNGNNTYKAVGLGNKDGNYYILDRTNGNILETVPVGTSESENINPDGGIIGLAAMTNTTNPEIFIPSYFDINDSVQGTVKAFYTSNSVSPWMFNAPGIVDGSVSTVPGAMIFGDTSGGVYAVNTTNGNELFFAQIPSAIVDGGITPAEGHLFVPTSFSYGGTDGLFVYAMPQQIQVNTTTSTSTTTTSTSTTSTIIPINTTTNETFQEAGLPSGTQWFVTYLNGITENASAPSPIAFSSNNSASSYPFAVQNATFNGSVYAPTLSTGTLSVNKSITINFVQISSPTSTTTSSTTTVSSGGGGGGGGGGSAKPVITNTTNGFTVNTLAKFGNFGEVFCGQIFRVTDNFITPTSTGVTINNKDYTLTVMNATKLQGTKDCYVELLNVSYLPILHTVQLEFFKNGSTTSIQPFSKPTVAGQLNVTIANNTGHVTPGNDANMLGIQRLQDAELALLPQPPQGFKALSAYNISVSNTTLITSLNLTMHFVCGTDVEPFVLGNGAWKGIDQFNLNSAQCTVNFDVPSDPIIALMQVIPQNVSAKPTTTITPAVLSSIRNTTSIIAQAQSTTISAQEKALQAEKYNIGLIIIAVAGIVIIYGVYKVNSPGLRKEKDDEENGNTHKESVHKDDAKHRKKTTTDDNK